MKGKYITTSVLLAVWSGGKNGISVLVDETPATTLDHATIWTKNNKKSAAQAKDRDELKLA